MPPILRVSGLVLPAALAGLLFSSAADAVINGNPGGGSGEQMPRFCNTGSLRMCLHGCGGQSPARQVTCQANCNVMYINHCIPRDPFVKKRPGMQRPLQPVASHPIESHPGPIRRH